MPDPSSPRFAPLRSRWAVGLWLVGALWLLVLGWQALVGWPLYRTVELALRPTGAAADPVYEGEVPARYASLDWNAPWVRVFVQGVEFRQVRDPEQLLRAPFPASRGKGDRVRLHAPGGLVLTRCTTQVPWVARSWLATTSVLAFVLWSVLLTWARHPGLLALGQKVRRFPLARLSLALVLGLAVLLRVRGFAFPAWENDSDDYFRPVLQWLSGLPVTPTDRPLGYPACIALALKFFADFRALLFWQQEACLAAGLLLAVVFFRAAGQLFPRGLGRLLVRLVGVAATALFLLNERVLQREWRLLPEAMTALWLGLQLWLAWRLLALPLTRRRLLAEFALFCSLGWLVFFTKSNWGFALALLPVPLLGAALLRSTSGRELGHWAFSGMAVLLGVSGGAWLFQHLTPLNTQASVEIRSRVFVCWHIDLIRPEIELRLAHQPAPREAALLLELRGLIDQERMLTRERGAGVYQTLGYDADRLYYVGYRQARKYLRLSSVERGAFCRDLFFGAVRHQPGLYARKVLRQMQLYFVRPYASATISPSRALTSLEQSERLLRQPPAYLPTDIQAHYRPVLVEARAQLEGQWPTPARMALSLRMQAVYQWLNPLFAWSLALSIVVVLAAVSWRRWREAVPWRQLAPVLGLLAWSTGSAVACALTSSALQALEIQRYIDLFLPLTLFSELLWPCVAGALIHAWWSPRTESAVQEGGDSTPG